VGCELTPGDMERIEKKWAIFLLSALRIIDHISKIFAVVHLFQVVAGTA
jgi:hypothetical protein